MLPPEISFLIAEYLPCNDKYTCLFVCREWLFNFLPTLYTSLLLKKYQLQPYHTIQRSALGDTVRELSLDDGVLTGDALENLGKICPYIRTLHFRWHSMPDGTTVHHRRRSSKRIDPNYYSCIPILSSIQTTQLQSITLCHFQTTNVSFDERSNSYGLFNEILPHIPHQIRILSLIGILPVVRATDLDTIHAHCPKLSELKLSGSNTLLTGDIDEPNTYPNMKKISLVYPGGWSKVADWLGSLSYRYPNLRILELENTSRGSAIVRANTTPVQQRFSEFANKHQGHIEKIRFVYLDLSSFDIYQAFLAPLCHLYDLTLHDRRCLDFSRLMDSLTDKVNVIRLDTQLETKDQTSPTTVFSPQPRQLYSNYECLKHLKSLNINLMHKNVQLRNLLDNNNSIKELTISHASLEFVGLQHQTVKVLEQLKLKHVNFSLSGIQLFLQGCTKLRDVYIKECDIIKNKRSHELLLDISSIHTLESMSLINLNVSFNDNILSRKPVTLFTLSLALSHTTTIESKPTHKKRRCDSPAKEQRRWLYIGESVENNSSDFDNDPNEFPFSKRKSQIQELDPKDMKSLDSWNPYIFKKYFLNPIPHCYISIMYCSRLNYLRLNDHKV
ncbi:hypothetical protein BDC45DRAFT_519292, partial [Circinella umbellata]